MSDTLRENEILSMMKEELQAAFFGHKTYAEFFAEDCHYRMGVFSCKLTPLPRQYEVRLFGYNYVFGDTLDGIEGLGRMMVKEGDIHKKDNVPVQRHRLSTKMVLTEKDRVVI